LTVKYITTIGVITQYKPEQLNLHIGTGQPWLKDEHEGEISIHSPAQVNGVASCFKGTANAVFQNRDFLKKHDPDYVLVLSGDHIYRMDYRLMLEHHKQAKADVTIAVTPVKWEDASRFGILSIDDSGCIIQFTEKPSCPQSNLASMGVYIFNRSSLEAFLSLDESRPESSNDFGKDIIPEMLRSGANLQAYSFEGYWRDIGTIESLWEAHMDLLEDSELQPWNALHWPIHTQEVVGMSPCVLTSAQRRSSILNDYSLIQGEIDHSVLSYGVRVGAGSVIVDSVVMPNVQIGENVVVWKAIIGEGAVLHNGVHLGYENGEIITVVGEGEIIGHKLSTVC